MIDRDVKESLQLMRVEVESQHPVRPRLLDDVGDQLGTNRHAGLILAILSRVSEVRHDGGHACRRRAACGVDEEQQLHHVFCRWIRGLDHEDIGTADILVDAHEHLAVSEATARHLAQLGAKGLRHFFGQRPVGRSRENLEAASAGRCVHASRVDESRS
jgi:hypothetical protein